MIPRPSPKLGEGKCILIDHCYNQGEEHTLISYNQFMNNKQRRHIPRIRKRAKELRQVQTEAEKVLWDKLRRKQLGGFKFRRQHPIDQYILDFFCPKAMLGIELDGGIHKKQKGQDKVRTRWLNEFNIEVIRFGNQEIFNDLDKVLENILDKCEERAKND